MPNSDLTTHQLFQFSKQPSYLFIFFDHDQNRRVSSLCYVLNRKSRRPTLSDTNKCTNPGNKMVLHNQQLLRYRTTRPHKPRRQNQTQFSRCNEIHCIRTRTRRRKRNTTPPRVLQTHRTKTTKMDPGSFRRFSQSSFRSSQGHRSTKHWLLHQRKQQHHHGRTIPPAR